MVYTYILMSAVGVDNKSQFIDSALKVMYALIND